MLVNFCANQKSLSNWTQPKVDPRPDEPAKAGRPAGLEAPPRLTSAEPSTIAEPSADGAGAADGADAAEPRFEPCRTLTTAESTTKDQRHDKDTIRLDYYIHWLRTHYRKL